MTLDEYILGHIDAEGDYLHSLWRDTQLRLSYGQMASGHLQGRVLKMLIEMAQPLKVLELGTFSGYAALCMAEGLRDGAELHTFEIFDDKCRKYESGERKLYQRLCAENGVVFLDLTEKNIAAALDGQLPFGFANTTPGTGHINRLGLRIFAEGVYEQLAKGVD